VRHHLLILEERKTSDLLATLLPERITEQLRNLIAGHGLADDGLIAEDHANVSILFSDICGFTAYSATITAREVVGFLSNLYTILDYLTSEHEVLKVETIGDAYFCASGVLSPREDHATLLANFSFAMLLTLRRFKLKGGGTLRMRIGLHSGRVIAGVVGLKVPRYHLFGESVTLASLMEQTGTPDRIQVSEAIASDLSRWTDDEGREMYNLEHRVDPPEEAEELLAKRNHMQTYWLTDGRVGVSEGAASSAAGGAQPTRSRMASAVPSPPRPSVVPAHPPSHPNTLAVPSVRPAAKSVLAPDPNDEFEAPPPPLPPVPVFMAVSAAATAAATHTRQTTLLQDHASRSDEIDDDDADDEERELDDADTIPPPPTPPFPSVLQSRSQPNRELPPEMTLVTSNCKT
jgi:class 3 adenylate cyclase